MSSPNNIIKTPVIKPEDISIDTLKYLSEDSFIIWCLSAGVEVDHNPIEFNNHRYLIPIYMDNMSHIVWQKAAQLGATVYMMLRNLWWLEKHQGRKAGLYFPTKEGVENLSKDRLTPMIDSCPSIKAISEAGDKLGLRKIGKSSFYLYHLGGVASKDSVPLDYVSFDEVRLCDPKDIDQALHRISHSPYKMKVLMSTAGLPDVDINARFQYGTQHIWRSVCGCREDDGCDLARTFPDCVVADDPRRPGEVYLRCPKCKWEIKDPQNGRYIPMNPTADYNSYHVSQLASKFRTPKEVWQEFLRTTNMEEFYNAALGLSYIDAANRGVTPGQLEKCINTDIKWMKDEIAANGKNMLPKTAMGVDQGGAYNYVTICDVNPASGKKRIRHVEVIEQTNPDYYKEGRQVSPFERLYELMEEFNVGLAVVDLMPNYNEALKFAQAFPGRVYLGWYQRDSKDVVQWADRGVAKESIRKAGPLLNFKYQCSMGRYPALSWSLGQWAQGDVEIPALDGLRQMMRDEKTNLLAPESPARRLFAHLPRLIKRWHETDAETGSGRWEWLYAGSDPHAAHATLYSFVALERLRKTASFGFI